VNLIELRKKYKMKRIDLAGITGMSLMTIRYIERRPVKEVMLKELEIYSTGLNIPLIQVINDLTAIETEAYKILGEFWEHGYTGYINATKTYNMLEGCDNLCTLNTMIKYSNARNPLENLRLNWLYYKCYHENLISVVKSNKKGEINE